MAETKPGVKTTEFWLTVIVIALSNLGAYGLIPDDSIMAKIVGYSLAIVCSVGAVLGYQLARSKAKE